MTVKISHHQREILKSLLAQPDRYICRHSHSYMLCDRDGNYLRTISSPTKVRLMMIGAIRQRLACPHACRPEHTESWWPQPKIIKEAIE